MELKDLDHHFREHPPKTPGAERESMRVVGTLTAYQLPDLLADVSLTVKLTPACKVRMQTCTPRPEQIEAIIASVRKSERRLLWYGIGEPDLSRKPMDFRHTRLAGSDADAECSIIGQCADVITRATAERDANFFLKFAETIKAERKHRGRLVGNMRPKPALVLVANWLSCGGGIPPLCAFTDDALQDLFNLLTNVDVGSLCEKTITRTLKLQRLKPALVKSVIRKGKTVVLD